MGDTIVTNHRTEGGTKLIEYIRETHVADMAQASCRYWRIKKGVQIEITAGAFNAARRAGKPWAQVITFPDSWEPTLAARPAGLILQPKGVQEHAAE